jgi:DNA gyrase/topoisomerase IV subunit A
MEYGRYINKFRSMPYIIDALKPVERRLLLSLYNVAKDHKVKSAKVVGDCIGNFHPHGDCLKSDTKIYLFDGSVKTIEELYKIGKEQTILAYDINSNRIVPTKAHSFRIGQTTNEYYKITIENKYTIECTNNHQFLPYNYKWTKAEDLNIYDNLTSIHMNKNSKVPYMSHGTITNIEKIEINNPEIFYDFTVDNYHNLSICINESEDNSAYYKLIITHNSSVYGCLVDTMAPNEFIITQGNFGSYGLKDDNPPAAMRYTECQLKPTIKDLAFKYIKYVDFNNIEYGNEPLALPSPLPIGLIGYDINFGISFSYIKIPRYTISDLAKRLNWLLENINKEKLDIDDESIEINEENFGPIIKPNFRNCLLKDRTNNRDFLRLLIKGKATIVAIPHGQTTNKNIEILGRVPGKSFESLLKATVKQKTDTGKEISIKVPANLLDNCGNKKNPYNINILIEPKDVIKDIKEFAKKIWNNYLITNINFNCLFYDDDGKLFNQGIDDILINNYNFWLYAKLKKRVKDLEILNKSKFENTGLQIIRNIIQNNPKIKHSQEIINIYSDLLKNKKLNNKIKLNIYDLNNFKFEQIEKFYTEEDINNIIKNKSIKQLIENEIDLKNIENQINIAINKINNIQIDGQNIIKNLITKII